MNIERVFMAKIKYYGKGTPRGQHILKLEDLTLEGLNNWYTAIIVNIPPDFKTPHDPLFTTVRHTIDMRSPFFGKKRPVLTVEKLMQLLATAEVIEGHVIPAGFLRDAILYLEPYSLREQLEELAKDHLVEVVEYIGSFKSAGIEISDSLDRLIKEHAELFRQLEDLKTRKPGVFEELLNHFEELLTNRVALLKL